ncbi:rho-related BTB domain-containing protein 1 [Biomphalaria glabrata]|nr:rho-related BTB domain-containing protein 1 [Biomphalaria glabrata]
MINDSVTGLEEVIKCVVVGDSGVGKTYLTCAFACNAKYSLEKLVKPHQATVWAIDHYQHDKEILERSLCNIDSCQVSLRIWDTFGYHEQDRSFAYREADVIILCFSVLQPMSLRNIQRIWYPEICRHTENTPVVLCGTQADLRYLCLDASLIEMEKGFFFRHASPKDIIIPSVAKAVAQDIGAPYYETSVLNHYGVCDVFINAARAALLERHKTAFWKTQLKKVKRPLIQAPMKMPVPSFPDIKIAKNFLKSDISSLLKSKSECDICFLVQGQKFQAHRICLSVVSDFFRQLFSLEPLMKFKVNRRKSDLLCCKYPERFTPPEKTFNDSFLDEMLLNNSERFPLKLAFNHPSVQSIEIYLETDLFESPHNVFQTYVTLCEEISAESFSVILHYLYAGRLECHERNLLEARKTSELLKLTDVVTVIENVLSGQSYLNLTLEKQFHEDRIVNLRKLALHSNFLEDISFQVDNGIVSAHKPLLMARCEMMSAMFTNDFIESASDIIPFPGITVETFRALKEYLYTGESPSLADVDCIMLIEVANRLCLPQLVNMVEASVVQELLTYDKDEMLQDAITLLEPSELYNAQQLSKFCQYILSINYMDVKHKHLKLFLELPVEKQRLIAESQWPPIWYLNEVDQYSKSQPYASYQQIVGQECNKSLGCWWFVCRTKH